jgi:hypothetical protein
MSEIKLGEEMGLTMAILTKKDLLEAIKDMPENMPIMIYSGCFYRHLEFVKTRKLWVDGEQIEVITLHPTPYAIKVE